MYQCSVCGYTYSDVTEDIEFAELSEDYKCPVCFADKDAFGRA